MGNIPIKEKLQSFENPLDRPNIGTACYYTAVIGGKRLMFEGFVKQIDEKY